MSIFEMVEQFNKQVIGIDRMGMCSIQDESEMKFLVGSIREELEEYKEAHGQDFIAEIDALMDLIYFAAGGLTRMGVPHQLSTAIFKAIHTSNMTKSKGKKENREVTHDLDAIKPDGWLSPERAIAKLLECHKCSVGGLCHDEGMVA